MKKQRHTKNSSLTPFGQKIFFEQILSSFRKRQRSQRILHKRLLQEKNRLFVENAYLRNRLCFLENEIAKFHLEYTSFKEKCDEKLEIRHSFMDLIYLALKGDVEKNRSFRQHCESVISKIPDVNTTIVIGTKNRSLLECCVKFMVSHGFSENMLVLMNVLLEYGASAEDPEISHLLIKNSDWGSEKMAALEALITHGANYDNQLIDGNILIVETIEHLADLSHQLDKSKIIEIVEIIMKAKPNLSSKSQVGETLHRIVDRRMSDQCRIDVIMIFLEHGLSVFEYVGDRVLSEVVADQSPEFRRALADKYIQEIIILADNN